MSARRIIKSARVEVQSGHGKPSSAPAKSASPSEKSANSGIELQLRRRGDLVDAIEVTCRCGRSASFDCLYDTKQVEPSAAG